MTLSLNALSTIANYKLYADIDFSDISQDALIELLINTVSDKIQNETGRKMGMQSYSIEKTVSHDRFFNISCYSLDHYRPRIHEIVLDQYPIQSVTVSQDGEEITDYTVDNDTGILTRKHGWHGTYDIQYTAGYVLPKDDSTDTPRTLPFDLEQAVWQLVSITIEMRESEHLVKEVIGPLQYQFIDGIPSHIQSVIDRYKRERIV